MIYIALDNCEEVIVYQEWGNLVIYNISLDVLLVIHSRQRMIHDIEIKIIFLGISDSSLALNHTVRPYYKINFIFGII